MTTGHDIPPDEVDSREADKRRDEALKRALAMPHKPHKEDVTGRRAPKSKSPRSGR